MPLISMKEMLEDARKRGYAACYCESWNLESLQGTVEAAERRNRLSLWGSMVASFCAQGRGLWNN